MSLKGQWAKTTTIPYLNKTMLIIIENDPQFVINKDLAIYLGDETLYLEKGEAIGFTRSAEGRLFWGQQTKNKKGDVLEFVNKTTIQDMLEACIPAQFDLSLDDQGDTFMKPVYLESKSTLHEKILKITLTETIPEKTIPVTKIRYEQSE